MGSARSGILGEATVNMAGYMSSKATVPISLPLKKCPYGTLLQVKIHCLTPIIKFREEVSKNSNSRVEVNQNADHQDMEIKSNKSENSVSRSNGSFSSKDLGFPSHRREPRSRGTSFSASGLHHRSDSAETFIEKETFSPRDGNSPLSDHLADDPYRSNHSSFNSRLSGSRNDFQKHGKEFEKSTSHVLASSSSKNLLEAAEDTIEELRLESKKWERNARKLMVDLEVLRMEFSDQSKKQTNLDIELSMTYMERDELKTEVEKMKVIMKELMAKRKSEEVLNFQSECGEHVRKELENEIKFQKENNADLALQLSRSQESNIELVDILQELEETIEKQKVEIENLSVLQWKVSDLEKTIERNSEENRTLLVQVEKLQESEKKLIDSVELLEKALEEKNSEEEKLRQSVEKESSERKIVDLVREIEVLKGKLLELERDCSELTDENLELLLKLKDLENNPGQECFLFDSESEKYHNLLEQLKMTSYHVKKPWYNVSSQVNGKFDLNLVDLKNVTNIDSNLLEKWADTMFNYFIELNKLLETKIVECEEVLKHHEDQIKERNEKVIETQKKLEDSILKENNLQFSIRDLGKEMDEKRSEIEKLEENLLSKDEEIGSLRRWRNEKVTETQKKLEESILKENNLQLSIRELGKEMDEKRSEIEKLEENLLSKDEEIGSLRQGQRKYEVQISDLLKEKQQMEEKIEIVERESRITTKCMDDLRSELMVLSSNMDSHVSANKFLERTSLELESKKHELELHILELDEDKLGLEDEIRRLGIEIDIQNVYLKQKLPDIHSLWLGAQAECEDLKMENQKLEEFSESLTEKCGTLQESNGEFSKHITNLEEKLREAELRFSDCSRRVETLEENLLSMLEDFDFKEKSLTSKLDVLVQENKKQKEKLFMTESLLDQIEKLQNEVENLKNQISEAHDERERIISESMHEVSNIQAEKAELEFSLQQVQCKVELTENELASSKLSYEMLMGDQEKTSKLLGNYRSREEKLKTAMNDFELKLTLSEYERQQLVEETANLKVQLQRIENLQDEVLGLKKELNESKFEKEKLEVSLKSISGEFEELKAEKISLIEKVSEYENCKGKRIALEEKLLQMECDLRAREEFSDEDAELKNELSRMKRANKQFQRNIQQLEEEKNEYLKRARDLEEELQSMEDKQDQGMSESRKIEMVKSISQQRRNKTKPSANAGQARELVTDQQNPYRDQLQVEIDNEYDFHDETPRGVGMDHMTKIELLENELAVALEANNKYEYQLQRFFSEEQNGHATAPRKSTGEGEVVARERYERTKSSLQTELRDLRDRYFQMSLKYAEVEAEREDLVMKLRESKNGKRNAK